MLSVRDLKKHYGQIMALRGVSFEVKKGDILGFLGPNGAGKTTSMRIIAGFIPATSGTAVIDGFDVARDPLEVKRRIGYLPEHTPLYPDMRVGEYLAFRAQLKGVDRRAVSSRVDYVMERTKLTDRKRQLVGTLSKGYRQRVGIADALVGDPSLLILDEPTIGLDPNQIREVRSLIKEVGQEHTIILSTHILPEVEMVCSRVVIVANGRSVAENTVSGLIESFHEPAVTASLRARGATLDEVTGALQSVEGVLGVKELPRPEADGEVVNLRILVRASAHQAEVETRAAAERIGKRIQEKGWALRELVIARTTLEDVFVKLTTRDAAEVAPASGNGEAMPAPEPAPVAASTTPEAPSSGEAST